MAESTIHIDRELVSGVRKGNRIAFKLLFEKYGARLYQFSRKYLRNSEDAEDLLSEVFLKIWENRKALKTETSFQSYLFTIAYNNIRQRYLKRSREERYVRIFALEYASEYNKDEAQFDYLEFSKKLDGVIDLLSPRRKEIFILHCKDELKNAEIAARLSLSEQFVKNQLSVARKFVVDKMKEDNRVYSLLLLHFFFCGE